MEGSSNASHSEPEVVLETLRTRGWCLGDLQQVKATIVIQSALAVDRTKVVDSVESELLNLDLRSIGGKFLPDPSLLRKSSYLQGPKVLQANHYPSFHLLLNSVRPYVWLLLYRRRIKLWDLLQFIYLWVGIASYLQFFNWQNNVFFAYVFVTFFLFHQLNVVFVELETGSLEFDKLRAIWVLLPLSTSRVFGFGSFEQISSVRDISKSSVDELSKSSNGRRLLRLGLTDGHSDITAIEYSHISFVPDNVVPGTKVLEFLLSLIYL